jgi:hypothetical protein
MAYNLRKYHRFFAIAGFALLNMFIWSCGVKKTIPQGEKLLRSNSIKIIATVQPPRTARVKASDLQAQILHRPNKRVLFNKVPIYLWLYSLGTKHNDSLRNETVKWRKKMRNSYGEPPVLLDPGMVSISADNIRYYLFNSGYFDASVTYKIGKQKRKVRVQYIVNTGKIYRINSVFPQPEDSTLILPFATAYSSVEDYRLWWPADLNKLNEARGKLAKAFRNKGFYYVSQESFRYEIDTLQDKKEAAIFIKMDRPSNGHYAKYRFGSTRLVLECSDVYKLNTYPDSVEIDGKKLIMNHYPFRAKDLADLVHFSKDSVFNQSSGENTYKALVESGLFNYVDIKFKIDTSTLIISPDIYLKAAPRMSFSFEPQGLYSPQGTSGTNFQTQSQRSFGVAGILSYTNRNALHHAELFRLSSVTSYEAIIRKDQSESWLYGLQQGFNASLSLPNFGMLKNLDRLTNSQKRNTVISLSYQFENNPNFVRSSLPASISFQFINPKISWYYTPLEISYNRNRIDPEFLPKLPALDQDFVKRVFTDQFISAAKLGLIFANNRVKPGETYVFTRAGFETSGNLHRWMRSLSSSFNQDSTYKFLGVNYFQYAKIEGEIRLRQTIDNLNSVAMRINSGVVLPYGNSAVVPYDKRYFIGGSNSLRAWRPRRLGPGGYSDTSASIIDRSGEFLFEANLEYRFTVIPKFLESALFLDIGNIWNLNHKGQTADARGILIPDFFGEELAINTGIGFRFDFKFFLFRLDWGLPLRDPAKAADSRWLLTKKNFAGTRNYIVNETALAIGIGYPF